MFLTSFETFGHQHTHLDQLSSSLAFHSTKVPTNLPNGSKASWRSSSRRNPQVPGHDQLFLALSIPFSLLNLHVCIYNISLHLFSFVLINFTLITDYSVHSAVVGFESIDPLRWLQKESQENSSGNWWYIYQSLHFILLLIHDTCYTPQEPQRPQSKIQVPQDELPP